MSEIVCQVGNQAAQAEFIWSSRGGFFKPYVIAGTQLTELRQAADQTRVALESLVFAINQGGSTTPWEPSFELAEAGFRLFNDLLPTEDETARKVRRWLEDLRKQSGLIDLEVVVEERSADPRAFLSVPWNLVYDERPAKHKAEFQQGQGAERWRPFWSVRYNLTSGRRVEPLKRLPIWIDPRVVVVVDPTVHEALDDEQKGRLDGFLAEAGLPAVGSLDELEVALEEGYPRLLYWLGHATPEYLMLGDERIAPSDLRNLLRSFDDRERPEGMLAFLNACQTAEAGSGGSFLEVLHSFGFTGAIATERQTIDTFANEFGIGFLRGFLREGKPLGELLHGLRLGSAPLGLVYGAHCPPEIRVRQAGEAAEVPVPRAIRETGPVAGIPLGAPVPLGHRESRQGLRSPHEPAPSPPAASPPATAALPEQPYRSLAYYDWKDRALFTGRDADIVRFAAALDRPDTRILILHGESGVGKSSFLRAGVIPYLEQDCAGYRFLRAPDRSPLIFQPAKDPVGQIAQALLVAAEAPLRYETPDGEPLVVDLRAALDEALGAPADYAALREALRRDPQLLARILTRMADRLPHALVLVLDQAEEFFTLAREPEEIAGRDQALRMLQRLVDVEADVKMIISLRTEYYGRLLDHLRAGRRDLNGVRDDLLRDFSRPALVEAIERPTSATPMAAGQPSPRERYGFRYADGVADLIAGGVLALRSENQDSVLPLVQVICTQLYERAKERPGSERLITREDLEAIKGVEGGLKAFAEDALVRSLHLGPADRRAFKLLFSQLYNRQTDGTLTTYLKRRSALEAAWSGRKPFDEVLDSAVAVRLLRKDDLRIEGEEPQAYVRLGHDALARVADAWWQEATRLARLRRLVAVAATTTAVAVAMGVLALFAWGEKRKADASARGLRIAAIVRDIRDLLERFDGGEAQLERIDGEIARLGELAPAEVAAQQRLRNQRLAAVIESEIRRPYLGDGDVDRIVGRIARLAADEAGMAADAPRMADELRARLRGRRRELQKVLSLAGSFEEAAAALRVPKADLTIRDDRLFVHNPAGGARPALVETQVPSTGDVELEVTIASTDGSAREFGLALDASGEGGYLFLASAADVAGTAPRPDGTRPSLRAIGEAGGRLSMTILRDKVPMRTGPVDVGPGPLRLRARRDGGHLEFQVNELTPLVFDEIIPLGLVRSGVFGLRWPDGVGLVRLEGLRQTMPDQPTAIERGDMLFGAERYKEALDAYRQVAQEVRDPGLGRLARYKQALCLIKLNSPDEARRDLEELFGNEQVDATLSLRAGLELWLLRVRPRDPKTSSEPLIEADAIFNRIVSLYKDKAEQLLVILPETERRYLLNYYRQKEDYWRIYWNRNALRNLQRAIDVERLIGADEQEVRWTRWRLIDAYRLEGRQAEARRLAEELLAEDLSPADRLGITKDYAWIMIRAGRPHDALPAVDRFLDPKSGPRDPALQPLLLERARLYAALGRWAEAEQDVDRFLETVPKKSIPYSDYAEACLMRGFLWDRRGEPGKAQEAWRAGTYRNWPAELRPDPLLVEVLDGKPMRDHSRWYYYMVVIGSLAGELTEDEAETALALQLKVRDATSSPIFRTVRLLAPKADFLTIPFVAKALTDSCRTRRGKDFARSVAFHQIDYADYFIDPVLHDVIAGIRHGAMTGGIPDDIEPIMWDSLKRLADQVRQGRLTEPQLGLFLAAYSGSVGFGWGGLSRSLDPQMVPNVAFVMGYRYQVLGSPDDARRFFRIVIDKAPADSPLRRWAEKAMNNKP
jgi:tetratricopeptide (TPR) repeat protein